MFTSYALACFPRMPRNYFTGRNIYVSHHKFQNIDTCLISVGHNMRERHFADVRGYRKLLPP